MRRLAALNAEMRARRRVLGRRWLAVGHPFLPPCTLPRATLPARPGTDSLADRGPASPIVPIPGNYEEFALNSRNHS